MRLSRTPLRITLGGGGSDLLPAGRCITCAINLYTYIAVNDNLDGDYSLKYSSVERANTIEGLKHDLFRRALQITRTPAGTELTSMSDIPAGTGLGSSGTFTVGILRVLLPNAPRDLIARLACQIDTGRQDQHAATYGGLRIWNFAETATSTILTIPAGFEHLTLFDTGLRRDTTETLRANRRPTFSVLSAQAELMERALRAGDMPQTAALLTAQWEAKLRAAPSPAHQRINHMIETVLNAGAVGAKLVGAGDGGMILAWCPTPIRTPYRQIRFAVDTEGTVLL